jgi:flagellar biosynthetic protein FliQ
VTEALLAIAREGLWLAILLAAPVLIASLLAGALTGLLGAVTQLQDPAVSLVPRIAASAAAIAMFGPSVARQLVAFGGKVLALVPTLGT